MVLKEKLDFRAFDGKEFATTLAYEVSITGSEYWLRNAWDNIFKPELENFAASLMPIITAQFQEAHEMLRLAGQVRGDWDRLSRWRKAIEVHEEDRYLTRPIDVIIDAARDVIEWLLAHRHDEASRLITIGAKGDIPILKRLVIHAMCLDSVSSGDQKLSWLLQKGWLYSLPFRHEVFRLIKTAYPVSEESTRNDFLEAVLQGPKAQGLVNLDVDASMMSANCWN